jgi:DNA-binding transcriptional regulator LsrR (DeoR family)
MATTDANALTAQQRRAIAVDRRLEGASFRTIASELGMSPAGVHKAVTKAMTAVQVEIDASAKTLKALESERLDALQAAWWGEALEDPARVGNTMLRLFERRAKLFGLDAPAKVAPTTPDGDAPYDPDTMSAAERQQRIAELEQKLADKG